MNKGSCYMAFNLLTGEQLEFHATDSQEAHKKLMYYLRLQDESKWIDGELDYCHIAINARDDRDVWAIRNGRVFKRTKRDRG